MTEFSPPLDERLEATGMTAIGRYCLNAILSSSGTGSDAQEIVERSEYLGTTPSGIDSYPNIALQCSKCAFKGMIMVGSEGAIIDGDYPSLGSKFTDCRKLAPKLRAIEEIKDLKTSIAKKEAELRDLLGMNTPEQLELDLNIPDL